MQVRKFSMFDFLSRFLCLIKNYLGLLFDIYMKDSPLVKLIALRKSAYVGLEQLKKPKVEIKNEEMETLRKQNQVLLEKLKTNEDLLVKHMNAMRHEIESRDKEIYKLKQEIASKEQEKNQIQQDLLASQRASQVLLSEKTDLIKFHTQEISDLQLQHDQEIYILRKLKKN